MVCPAAASGARLSVLDDRNSEWLLARNMDTGKVGWVPRSGVSPFNSEYTPPVQTAPDEPETI